VRRLLSTEEEKSRLQEICAYKGGKGLPEELLLPVGKEVVVVIVVVVVVASAGDLCV